MRVFLTLVAIYFCPAISHAFDEQTSQPSYSQAVTVLTDYHSDGVSQTHGNAAIQWFAQADFSKTDELPDLYARLFASNVQFAHDKGYEFDIGVGTQLSWLEMQWDFGLLNNFNLAFNDVDSYFLEVYAGLFVADNRAIYFTYSDDSETFDGGNNAKLHWDHAFSINDSLSWAYQIGYTDMYRSRLSNSDYIWWTLGLQYDYENFNFNLKYHDTDIKKRLDFNDIAQQAIVASVSINF